MYRYVLDDSVAESILSLSNRQRERFIQIFRTLADDPFQSGEQTFKDSLGRNIQKKKFDRWLISYWPDHAVKEVRIVGAQQAKI
jgi:mRNA-degrading endonuclease RelE of RelBE toxin-antitoxin system